MKALVLGATGAIGKDLVEQLLQDYTFDRVDIFVRREVKIPSAKLVAHVVNFDHPEQWADRITGDVLFSCLGTTIKAASAGLPQDENVVWISLSVTQIMSELSALGYESPATLSGKSLIPLDLGSVPSIRTCP